MKKLLLLYLLVCFSVYIKAQDLIEFESVDRKILSIPISQTWSAASLARFIQFNFKTDREKLRAAYTWVTNNIAYSTDSMYAINWSGGHEAKITEALRRRKGVCENYAAIFNDVAVRVGLTSFVVDGYTKQGGSTDRMGHSWCAICLQDEWLFCDPTWDKDAQNNTGYFLVNPDIFLETHMPFDPMWQLQYHPVPYRSFRVAADKKKALPFFNFPDSIKAFRQQSGLQQLQASVLRMKTAGQISELIKNRVAFTNMQIGLIYEERDMNLYNSAVAGLNHATQIFNQLAEYRNNQLTPLKTRNEIADLFHFATEDIRLAYKKIGELSEYNLQYDPDELRYKLDGLLKKFQEQEDFFKIN
ncbi:MAG: transglutaminase domain-containing protein [Ferruginibacter sp.]